jgi:hypothetical protein
MTRPAPRHRFHALSPYFAMFPESFAEQWIERLSKPGDLICDPFCGRGTTPFQANLMDRAGLACDLNPVAFVLAKAKTNSPPLRRLLERLAELGDQSARAQQAFESVEEGGDAFFQLAFSARTLGQLLFLRDRLDFHRRDDDCMIAALVLGILHGESQKSQYYLSNQMPRTISTKPRYSVKFWRDRNLIPPDRDVFDILRGRAEYRYHSPRPRRRSRVHLADMRELPRVAVGQRRKVRLVVTSPPYLDTTSFEEDQWLRLWFLGGPSRPVRGRISRDDRRTGLAGYWEFIGDMWRTLGIMMAPRGHVVIRLAGKGLTPQALVDGLEGTSVLTQRPIRLVEQEISPLIRRQTDAFRPGSTGRQVEVDVHFEFRD